MPAVHKKFIDFDEYIISFFSQVLESVVKNCGSTIHTEIATKEFMEFMKDQSKVRLFISSIFSSDEGL